MPCIIRFPSCIGSLFSAGAVVLLFAGTSIAEEYRTVLPEKNVAEAEVEPLHPDKITVDYFEGYLTDTGNILASPLNWGGSDWRAAGLVVGTTAGLYFSDSGIRDFARRNQNLAGNKIAVVGNALGNPLFILPPLALLYLYGQINEEPKARRVSLLAVESLAISGAFATTIKLLTRRPRPNTGEPATIWDGPGLTSINTAFPSIHTQSAFSVATVFAEVYGNNPYVPSIAYGLATVTGFARVYDNKHWASDVFFGGAVGYFVGKAVVRYHTAGSNSPLKIMPTVSQQGFGMSAEYRF